MSRYRWATLGDLNAFFGLTLDNVANLVLTVGLLGANFEFPASFILQNMIPGTALGVLIGDACFFWMALRLARRTGNPTVTAMPLGLDTPSTLGMVFFVLGPSFVAAKGRGLTVDEAATHAWHIGICVMVYSGLFKLGCATCAPRLRRQLPRAGLLGSLAAIALALISFLPLLEIAGTAVVGFVSLAIILTTLIARVEFPLRVPGALAALLVGGAIYYLMLYTGTLPHDPAALNIQPRFELVLPNVGWSWFSAWNDSLLFMPVVIPFALATVIGGIDCAESAIAAGDDYPTGRVIAVEAFATLLAGLAGGVIQTTPYIGHPAYKAMGARAAYVLATGLFIGGAGTLGYFAHIYQYLPQAAIFPILVFVGLEITSQSFQATPARHYPAVALACLPALAYLVTNFTSQLHAQLGGAERPVVGPLAEQLETLRLLANGFIISSLLWASMLAATIDKRLGRAAAFAVVAAVAALFGVIHSPAPNGGLVVPWRPPASAGASGDAPLYFAAAYGCVAVLFFLWSLWLPRQLADGQNEPASPSTTAT